MNCADARDSILAHQRGTLTAGDEAAVRDHLATCPECARVDAAERALGEALEHRLPQHPASVALKRRLAALGAASVPARRARPRWLAPAFAAAAVVLVTAPLLYQQLVLVPRERTLVLTEAVNDHLRVLLSQRPLEVESGGIHQVKPWFAGRLDFAPVVNFGGDTDFPLRGGAVGYFLDRRAAVFLFTRRLHPISLFVVRADGLPWPSRRTEATTRGFNVITWRGGELGYALDSDVDVSELRTLAAKLAGEPV